MSWARVFELWQQLSGKSEEPLNKKYTNQFSAYQKKGELEGRKNVFNSYDELNGENRVLQKIWNVRQGKKNEK